MCVCVPLPFFPSSLLRERDLGDLVLDLVPQQLVVEVDGHGRLVDSKHLHGVLHAVKGRGLPHKVHTEVVVDVCGHSNVGLQLQTNLLTKPSCMARIGVGNNMTFFVSIKDVWSKRFIVNPSLIFKIYIVSLLYQLFLLMLLLTYCWAP